MSTEVIESTFDEQAARDFTLSIRRAGEGLAEKLIEAYEGYIWVALGYPEGDAGWQEYLIDEFPNGFVYPSKQRQLEAVRQYDAAKFSIRAIADVTGLGKSTVQRRVREVRELDSASSERPGVPNGTPEQQLGKDGKRYGSYDYVDDRDVEDAEVVDEDEASGSGWEPTSRPSSDGHVDVDSTPADQLGLEPKPIDFDQRDIRVTAETVQATIRDFNGSGSADTVRIKRTAALLTQHLTSGMVAADVWDEDELSVLAEDTVDTMISLADLLIYMAEGTRTNGVSRTAIEDSEIHGPLSSLQDKLTDISRVLNRQSVNA